MSRQGMNAAFPNGTCKSDIDHTNISMQELHIIIRKFGRLSISVPAISSGILNLQQNYPVLCYW